MRTAYIIAAYLTIAAAAMAGGYKVKLRWDANPEPDVIGYRVHWGTESGRYPNPVNVGDTTEAELDLDPLPEDGSSYYSVVTAYNAAGLESFPSNEVEFSNHDPSRPKDLRTLP